MINLTKLTNKYYVQVANDMDVSYEGTHIKLALAVRKDNKLNGMGIIYIHGGFAPLGDLYDHNFVMKWARDGYAIFAPDFTVPMSLSADLAMMDKLVKGLKNQWTKGHSLFLAGVSRGGYLGALAVAANPDAFTGAAFCVAPMQLSTLNVSVLPPAYVPYFTESPIDYVDKLCDIPIGLAYGDEDDLVPVSQGAAMYKALVKAGAYMSHYGRYKGGHNLMTTNPDPGEDISNFFRQSNVMGFGR